MQDFFVDFLRMDRAGARASLYSCFTGISEYVGDLQRLLGNFYAEKCESAKKFFLPLCVYAVGVLQCIAMLLSEAKARGVLPENVQIALKQTGIKDKLQEVVNTFSECEILPDKYGEIRGNCYECGREIANADYCADIAVNKSVNPAFQRKMFLHFCRPRCVGEAFYKMDLTREQRRNLYRLNKDCLDLQLTADLKNDACK